MMRETAMGFGSDEDYRHADPDMDAALDWYLRLNHGETVPDSLGRAFRAWLAESPAHLAAFREVEAVWADPVILDASRQWQVCSTTARPVVPPRRAWRLAGLARHWQAVAAVLLLTLGALQFAGPLILRMRADYRTDVGQRAEIRLPDGSRMILNGNSAVTLDFDGGRRDVTLLDGEAWFDVVHDAAHPFRVAGRFSDTWVVGTRFAVKLEPQDDMIALQSGVVEAVHHDASLPVRRLAPGQMVRADSKTISAVSTFDSDEALGWLDGRYAFAGKRLGDVLRDLEDSVPERIVVLNRSLLDVAISGNFRLDRPDALVRGIAAAAGGQATWLPGGFVIIR
ncbi:FecR domain-containing protein [Rhizobium sp. CSW-27]|uniref:FecR family protein n=1 Tax=Rhizobium sp. CSW-27 TaxID=2839985 RepID=UPI001C028AA7|nr:FecR domain-containing protein [Rhizobium sp. CSW-27]MBT9369894.1 FecR domain-containing protein [Rhizobium sp. CSW-27]